MNCLLVMKIKWSLNINTGAVERSEAARARCLAGATVVGPVTAQVDQLWHAETGPPCARTTIPNPDHYNQRAFLPGEQYPCRILLSMIIIIDGRVGIYSRHGRLLSSVACNKGVYSGQGI